MINKKNKKPSSVLSFSPRGIAALPILATILVVALIAVGAIYFAVRQPTNANSNVAVTNVSNNTNAGSQPTSFQECRDASNTVVDGYTCSLGEWEFVRVANATRGYAMEYEVMPEADGRRRLVNREFGFSLIYPRSYTQRPEPAQNGKVNLLDRQGNAPISVWSERAPDGESVPTWGEYKADGDITLGQLEGKRFVYKVCDGPSCTSDIIAYVVLRDGNKYAIEFRGDATIDDLEQDVLRSFAFLQ